MKAAEEFCQQNDIKPNISFKDGLAHEVELVSSKLDQKEYDGETKKGITCLVKEGGVEKTFFTSSISLIASLTSIQIGDKVVIELVSRKGSDGGFKSSFILRKAGEAPKDVEDVCPTIDVDDIGGIPVID